MTGKHAQFRPSLWLQVFLCLLQLSLIVTPAAAAQSGELDPVTLQLKWTHAFQFAGYYAALEKGYYREAGLEVTIVEATPGVDPIKRVIDGEAQYGVGTSSLLLERKAGKPVVALAAIFQHSPYVLIARQQSATQTIHDLVGKRIMLEPQSEEILAYLKAEGVPRERITRVDHSYDLEDLIAGRVDAIAGYVTDQPYYLDRTNFPYQAYTPRSAGIDFYGDNLFTNEQELREHPARVKALRAASLRGWQYAMEHQEEIVDLILARYSQRHTRDYYLFEARQMVPLLRPDLTEIGYMNPRRWAHIAAVYAELGMMKPDFDLKGFLYDPNPPPPDLTWQYVLIGVSGSVAAALAGLAVYIHRINVRLRRAAVERKRAAKALQEREREYRLLFDGMLEGFALHEIICDSSGKAVDYRFLSCNPAFERLTGLCAKDVIGRTVMEVLPGTEALWIERYGRVALTGVPDHFEEFSQSLGRHFEVQAFCPQPGQFVTAFEDITARRRAEGYREMKQEVLQILNEHGDWQGTIERVLATLKVRTGFDAVGIRLQDGEDFPYFAQQGFSEGFLRTENTLLERSADGTVLRDKEGNARLGCTCGLVISGKTDPSHPLFTSGGSFWTNDSFPLLDLPADQDPRLNPRNQCMHQGYASMALVPIRNEDRIVGLVHIDDRRKGCFTLEMVQLLEGIASHIGAALMRKRAEEMLRTAKETAETATKVKEQFLAKLSHELRTPLTPVLLAAAQWETQTGIPAGLRDDLAMVRRNLELEARLLEDLLDVNRILYGKLSLRREVLSVHQVIAEALGTVAPSIQAKHLNLSLQLQASNDSVHGDPTRVKQILWNLLSNAMKFTPEGGSIVVSTANDLDGQFRVQVADSGMGIEPEVLARLFSPFEQGSQHVNHQYGGMGLGLSICKSMAEAHGGSITVASAGKNKGTTFTVRLPLTQVSADVERAMPAPLVQATAAVGRPLRVLLVEDHADTARMMSRLLRAKGYAVQTASDVASAMACLQGHAFDLLVSDFGSA